MDVNMTRREALAAATAGGAAVAVGGGVPLVSDPEEALAQASCVMTPELTIGPYFVEEKLNRSDIRGGQEGVAVVLTMNVFDYSADCAPVSGALVDVWHANALGRYSDVSQNNTSGQTWLRGYQTTGADGQVVFTTIFPGYYSGRTTHIHVRVRVNSLDYTTQIFFTEDQAAAVNQVAPYTSNTSNGTRVKNTTDNIYQQGGGNVLLVTLSGDPASGFTGELSMGVDPGTATATPTATGTATPTATPADSAVDASFLGLTIGRRRNGVRRLRLRVRSAERLGVAVKVTRKGNQVARLFGEIGSGSRVINVRIPKRLKPGAARVRLILTDEAGNKRTIRRTVHIPQKR